MAASAFLQVYAYIDGKRLCYKFASFSHLVQVIKVNAYGTCES